MPTMKTLYSLLLCVALGAATFTAMAQTAIPGTNLTWSLSGGTLTIDGSGAIPTYTATGAPWYPSRASVTDLVIGNGVSSIGDNAFRDCALANLTIPATVTSIGENAFHSNSKLKNLVIEDGATSLTLLGTLLYGTSIPFLN